MSKHPPGPPPPPRLALGGHPDPGGRAAPPPRRPDERGSLRARLISCQQPFGRRGAAERQRGSAPGGRERGGLPRGSRAPAEAGKLARPTAFPFQRKRGPAAPHPAPGRWVGSRGPQAAGPGRDFRRGCGARRGRPRAPPAGRTSTSRAKPSTSLVAPQRQPTPGYHWAARRSCCQTTAGPPSRSHGPAGQKLLMTGGNNTLGTAALRGQPEVRRPPPPATDTCSSQARCEAGEFGFSNPVVAFIKTEDL